MALATLVVVWVAALGAALALVPLYRLPTLSFVGGWIAGELGPWSLIVSAALSAALVAAGWPRGALGVAVALGAAAAVVGNGLDVVVQFRARAAVVQLAQASSPAPFAVPRPNDVRYGRWWRTVRGLAPHPRWLEVVANQTYGPADRQRLDVWRRRGHTGPSPVLLFIHGGAWVVGSKKEQGRPFLHELVARGWVAVCPNYRLAPGAPWPAQIEDVTAALGWIRDHAAEIGADPSRIVVAGGSAGGHLAALLALTAEDPQWRPNAAPSGDWSVRGCISFYGVLEMTGDRAVWRGHGGGLRHLLERRVVQQPIAGHESLYAALNPIARITPGAPPFLVVQGRNDTLVDPGVARAFVERFRSIAAAPCYLLELPRTQHAFDMTASVRTSAVVRAAVGFAESVVAGAPIVAAVTPHPG